MAGTKMKQLKLQLHHLSVYQVAIFLLILGLFFGVLCANLFHNNYETQLQNYEEQIFPEIATSDINYSGFFFYVIGQNFGEFIAYWLLSLTILGVPYMAFKITSFGFLTGFLISAVTMQYGLKGIILVLAYVFPQGLIYLPISLICLYRGFRLCRTIYQTSRINIGGIFKELKTNFILVMLLAVALLFGSFLEAYPGAFLLKKALGLFL